MLEDLSPGILIEGPTSQENGTFVNYFCFSVGRSRKDLLIC